MIISPSAPLRTAVGTVAPARMEDSSALTRLKRSPKSSAIPIASQYYLGRVDSTRLSCLAQDLLAIAAYIIVRNSTMALTTIKVSAISWSSLTIATISGISFSITTLLLNGSSLRSIVTNVTMREEPFSDEILSTHSLTPNSSAVGSNL